MSSFEQDMALYKQLTFIYTTRLNKKSSTMRKRSAIFIVLGVDRIISKILLSLVGASLLGLLCSLALDVQKVVSTALLTVFLLSGIAFEISIVYNIIEDQRRSGEYKLLSTVERSIRKREETIEAIIRFPADCLTRVKSHLKDEVSSRRSYLHLLLGGSINLGAFPALFAVYAAYTGTLSNSLPNQLNLAVLTIIIGLYIVGVIFSLEIRRLESMIHCLQCAMDRKVDVS